MSTISINRSFCEWYNHIYINFFWYGVPLYILFYYGQSDYLLTKVIFLDMFKVYLFIFIYFRVYQSLSLSLSLSLLTFSSPNYISHFISLFVLRVCLFIWTYNVQTPIPPMSTFSLFPFLTNTHTHTHTHCFSFFFSLSFFSLSFYLSFFLFPSLSFSFFLSFFSSLAFFLIFLSIARVSVIFLRLYCFLRVSRWDSNEFLSDNVDRCSLLMNGYISNLDF